MKTIQKRADELKPGDVVFFDGRRAAFQYVSSAQPGALMSAEHRLHMFAGLGSHFDSQPGIDRIQRWMPPAMPVDVEAPALTPAQEHAEELLRYFRDYLALCQFDFERLPDEHNRSVLGKRISELSALLAKIDPPKAPTYEETLAALDALLTGSMSSPEHPDMMAAQNIVDRARRAGVMP